ncbi:hypothetical protein BJY04DRAFT_63241 [Aspergillus karnatakaensis]|uniref:uncharacterized protein n=1 Tax=Aspergillus karnatakaensis TaxID=1810916 RepID=UPI003CCCA444
MRGWENCIMTKSGWLFSLNSLASCLRLPLCSVWPFNLDRGSTWIDGERKVPRVVLALSSSQEAGLHR